MDGLPRTFHRFGNKATRRVVATEDADRRHLATGAGAGAGAGGGCKARWSGGWRLANRNTARSRALLPCPDQRRNSGLDCRCQYLIAVRSEVTIVREDLAGDAVKDSR